MLIRAAVVSGVGQPIRIEKVDLQEPKSGEVLVRIRATGVCHSDWHVVTGATPHPLPVVIGHEGAGIVESVGPHVTNVLPGDHVSLNWAPSCGKCFYCTHGRPGLCATSVGPIWAGTMLDGSTRLTKNGKPLFHFSGLACFAEWAVVPKQSCIPVPRELPFEIASLIGCAVTTGVGAVLNTARVEAGSSVAVIGCGGVGVSIILGARFAGAKAIIAVDQSPAKEGIAMAAGATHYLSGRNIADKVRELTGGRGADYVFEAIGIPAVQETALDAVRPGGTVVLAGISPVGTKTNFPGALLTRQEKTVMGSYYGTSDPKRDFPLFAQYYLQRKLPLDVLVSERYALDQINTAYEHMKTGHGARGVIVF